LQVIYWHLKILKIILWFEISTDFYNLQILNYLF